MRVIIFFILSLLPSLIFSQEEINLRLITGRIIDSVTLEPLPFANINIDSLYGTMSDYDGNFAVKVRPDSVIYISTAYSGYVFKKERFEPHTDSIIIKMQTYEDYKECIFQINSPAHDTVFDIRGRVLRVNYEGSNCIEFYLDGQKKHQNFNGSIRSWYPNGEIQCEIVRSDSVFMERHWDENGQLILPQYEPKINGYRFRCFDK